MHVRRCTLRAVFATARVLGLVVGDPVAGLTVPAKTGRACRPLQGDELVVVQLTALGRVRDPLRTAAVVALAEATATTGELARIRWSDVDLDEGWVFLPGATPVVSRRGGLSRWGVHHLGRFRDMVDGWGEAPVAHRGRSAPDSHVGQASMSRLLGRLLTDAGLTEADIRPTSIRLCGPARLLEEGGRIEVAAAMLGLSSLDAAADLLAYDWRTR